MPGYFIVFEGIDGSGKSTQLALAAASLRERGYAVTTCRDPGSTAVGDAIRKIVVDGKEVTESRAGGLAPVAEMLLFQAARAQMVAEVIRPALARGEVVLCDRFFLSTVVYQGIVGGLPLDDLWTVGRIASLAGRPGNSAGSAALSSTDPAGNAAPDADTAGGLDLTPDLTLAFRLPPALAFERASRREGAVDRFQARGAEYLRRVGEGFDRAFADAAVVKGWLVNHVDASRGPKVVSGDVLGCILGAEDPMGRRFIDGVTRLADQMEPEAGG